MSKHLLYRNPTGRPARRHLSQVHHCYDGLREASGEPRKAIYLATSVLIIAVAFFVSAMAMQILAGNANRISVDFNALISRTILSDR